MLSGFRDTMQLTPDIGGSDPEDFLLAKRERFPQGAVRPPGFEASARAYPKFTGARFANPSLVRDCQVLNSHGRALRFASLAKAAPLRLPPQKGPPAVLTARNRCIAKEQCRPLPVESDNERARKRGSRDQRAWLFSWD